MRKTDLIHDFVRAAGRRRAFLPILLALFVTACSSHKAVTRPSPEPTSSPEAPASDYSSVPPDTTRELPPSVGEQLGRLDALMKTASGDSLAHLQAEYDRILRAAGGQPEIQTGMGDHGDMASHPRRIGNGQLANEAANDTSGAGNLKGLRPDELNHTSLTRRTMAATPVRKAATPSHLIAARTESRREVSEPATARPSTTGNANRKMLDGITAANAGKYSRATDDLPAALSGSLSKSNRNRAQYTYGHSLEKTGKLSKAAESYQQVTKDDRQLGDKSYVSYCRVLSESGQRDRARQLLIGFIAKHPKSPEVISARRLLQTL